MKVVVKLFVCWVAFVAALMLTGFLTQILHLRVISLPGNAPQSIQFLAQLGAGALLVVGLCPLALRIGAPPALRALMLAGFLFLALGINGFIETRTFTHLLDGRIPAAILFYVLLAVLVGSALGFLFGQSAPAAGLPHRTFAAWCARIFAAWFGWPPIYLAFGMCVAPIVVPYYKAGNFGLILPAMSTVVSIQLVRSLVFLAASLPFIAEYKSSRRSLWITLGLAHAFTVGIYGLAGATFMPWVLRITHGIEMTCDSFVYAGLLVLLFAAPAVAPAASRTSFPHPHPRPL